MVDIRKKRSGLKRIFEGAFEGMTEPPLVEAKQAFARDTDVDPSLLPGRPGFLGVGTDLGRLQLAGVDQSMHRRLADGEELGDFADFDQRRDGRFSTNVVRNAHKFMIKILRILVLITSTSLFWK
jgi:hypothetical protein